MRLAHAIVFFLTPGLALAQSSPDDLLDKVRQYAQWYRVQAPSIVARETYTQNASYNRSTSVLGGSASTLVGTERRTLISELVMVRLPGNGGWMSFRDVLEVDKRPVSNRQQRLVDLLQSPNPTSLNQARQLAAESARFNLGSFRRTINVPDIAFEYLDASRATRVTFESPRRARIDGVDVMEYRFSETGRPSVLTDAQGRDLQATGRVWVDGTSGAIVRTELRVRDRGSNGLCIVDFQLNERLAMRVPSRMTEEYRATSETVTAVATYSDYRQFAVSTNEKITKPPPSR